MGIVFHEAAWPIDIRLLVAAIRNLTRSRQKPLRPSLKAVRSSWRPTVEDRDVGFKLGYVEGPDSFYSWIGGVEPAFRKHGVARELLRLQKRLVSEMGITKIRVKSMNRFPAMLRFLISEGYQIIEVERREGREAKIVFEKVLPGEPRPETAKAGL